MILPGYQTSMDTMETNHHKEPRWMAEQKYFFFLELLMRLRKSQTGREKPLLAGKFPEFAIKPYDFPFKGSLTDSHLDTDVCIVNIERFKQKESGSYP